MRRPHQGSPIALPGFNADGPPGRACHSTSFIGYGYVRHLGLSFALQPPQSMSGNKMDDPRWAPHANSKQISISIEASLSSGTSCMVRDDKWATTHDSTLFGQEVRLHFRPGSTLVFGTDHFLTFGAKTTRSTSQFFGKY